MSKSTVLQKYDFRWEVLDVLIGGKSIIDTNLGLSAFPMKNIEDADRFMRSYGYDLEDPIENAEAHGNFQEGLAFVRKYFLFPENPDGLKLDIPRKIAELGDVRNLLLMAGMNYPGQNTDPQGVYIKDWACALLKLIHSIAHMDKDVRTSYYSDIQKQIFDRFYRLIHRDAGEKLFLGQKPDDELGVKLVAFDTKPKKSRESVLIKLLHKAENVAEDIFDRVGLRFITETPLDALRVVKFLKDSMIVMPANVKPSRSRNTLIDIDAFKNQIGPIMEKFTAGTMTEAQFEEEIQKSAHPKFVPGENPHTSEFYRAIQFTCRQLIKLKNPLFDDLKEMKLLLKNRNLQDNIAKLIEKVDLKYLSREVRFFYPFEIQVMDRESHEENERGRSAHSEYKKSQIQTAMKRVMGNLIHAQTNTNSGRSAQAGL